ncbi:MAG: hypothetical protein PHE06_09830 [Lachnospiraceae bacterium]|nr:hypothetical protein [Lachnospiraceae bacterium]MDD3796247.1 hypothetical protein [Lachnospiraceae bacterium]
MNIEGNFNTLKVYMKKIYCLINLTFQLIILSLLLTGCGISADANSRQFDDAWNRVILNSDLGTRPDEQGEKNGIIIEKAIFEKDMISIYCSSNDQIIYAAAVIYSHTADNTFTEVLSTDIFNNKNHFIIPFELEYGKLKSGDNLEISLLPKSPIDEEASEPFCFSDITLYDNKSEVIDIDEKISMGEYCSFHLSKVEISPYRIKLVIDDIQVNNKDVQAAVFLVDKNNKMEAMGGKVFLYCYAAEPEFSTQDKEISVYFYYGDNSSTLYPIIYLFEDYTNEIEARTLDNVVLSLDEY